MRSVSGNDVAIAEARASQHPVGPAEDRVLLVQHARNAEPAARHQRRHRGVAAEAHGSGRSNPPQHAGRLHDRTHEPENGDAARQGPAHARAAGCDGMSFNAPKNVAKGDAPPIRHENKTTATCLQLCREGFSRKHVAASSACCEKNGRVGSRRSQSTYPSLLRRSRVSASTMPRPIAVAIVDEPP